MQLLLRGTRRAVTGTCRLQARARPGTRERSHLEEEHETKDLPQLPERRVVEAPQLLNLRGKCGADRGVNAEN
eukprot:99097-Chlamydomonas_euryale.AAC.6